jgi:hypothetical protein
VRALVINDPTQIEIISRYVEQTNANSYIGECIQKELKGNINVKEEDRCYAHEMKM